MKKRNLKMVVNITESEQIERDLTDEEVKLHDFFAQEHWTKKQIKNIKKFAKKSKTFDERNSERPR